jgi:hypothetical protein
MGEVDEFDLAVEQAWAAFESSLTAALSGLGEHRLDVTVQCGRAFDLDSGAPWLWVDLAEAGVLRLTATPRDDLLARFRLRRWQRRRLVEQGWPAFTVDSRGVPMVGSNVPSVRVAQTDAADLARLMAGLVREIWAVPHPAFLDVDDVLEPAPVEGPLGDALARPICGEGAELPPLPVLAWPTDRSALEGLVADTVAGAPHVDALDQPADDDGHYLLCEGLMLRVGVHASLPIVELRIPLLMDVDDPHRARLEVNLANRSSDVAHYVLAHRQVFADTICPGLPFVPDQLRWLIATFSEEVARTQEAMRERLDATSVRYDDGQVDPDEAMADDSADHQGTSRPDPSVDRSTGGPAGEVEVLAELPQPLMTLIQLDQDGETPLHPRLVASVCDNDRGLVLRLMHIVELEVISWGSAADDARGADDVTEAEACDRERTAWEKTLSHLRAALRFVVENTSREEAA